MLLPFHFSKDILEEEPVGAMDASGVLTDSDSTDSAYVIQTKTTPPFVNRLPDLSNKDVSCTSTARRTLFQESEQQNQSKQTDEKTVKDPLPPRVPAVYNTASHGLAKKNKT